MRGHLIGSHTDERPFACTVCGLDFVRKHDRKSHELTHTGERKFVCEGVLANGQKWGCGRRFSLGKNLSRHFRSEKGKMCNRPRLEEEISKRQVAASALTGLAGSLPAPGQHHQPPPPPVQNWLYDDPSIPIDFTTPIPLVSNEEEQLPRPEQHTLQRPSATAPPTRDEALRAADTVRRYIRYHGRLNTEEDGFHGYLELTFKSVAVSLLEKPDLIDTTSLEPVPYFPFSDSNPSDLIGWVVSGFPSSHVR